MTALTAINMKNLIPLVTGGGSGIGFGIVKEFLKRGCPKVLITGRREGVLEEAATQFPGQIFYNVGDCGSAADRVALLEWVTREHPDCNGLVNNAGIQRRGSPSADTGSWEERAAEIEINFAGPVHLCTLFIPYLLAKAEPTMIANVTSGLAFVPFAAGPVYSATKAAMHSYTAGLRHSLAGTSLRLVEIVPPAVKTNLGGAHDFGEELGDFCDHVMERVEAGELEVGFKFSEVGRQADRATLDSLSAGMVQMMQVQPFKQE